MLVCACVCYEWRLGLGPHALLSAPHAGSHGGVSHIRTVAQVTRYPQRTEAHNLYRRNALRGSDGVLPVRPPHTVQRSRMGRACSEGTPCSLLWGTAACAEPALPRAGCVVLSPCAPMAEPTLLETAAPASRRACQRDRQGRLYIEPDAPSYYARVPAAETLLGGACASLPPRLPAGWAGPTLLRAGCAVLSQCVPVAEPTLLRAGCAGLS